jgi:hypothetical protein
MPSREGDGQVRPGGERPDPREEVVVVADGAERLHPHARAQDRHLDGDGVQRVERHQVVVHRKPLERRRRLLVDHRVGQRVLASQLGARNRLQAAAGAHRELADRLAPGIAQGVRKLVVVARVTHLGRQERVQLQLPLPVLVGQGADARGRLG